MHSSCCGTVTLYQNFPHIALFYFNSNCIIGHRISNVIIMLCSNKHKLFFVFIPILSTFTCVCKISTGPVDLFSVNSRNMPESENQVVIIRLPQALAGSLTCFCAGVNAFVNRNVAKNTDKIKLIVQYMFKKVLKFV